MSDSALTMSLADIIKKGKQNRPQKAGKKGTKPAFRFNKKQNFGDKPKGRSVGGANRGRGRIRNKTSQRPVIAYKGKGSFRGGNRAAIGRIPNRGKQQFRRINNKIGISSPRKGQNFDSSSRLSNRTQRFAIVDPYPDRYRPTTRTTWKSKPNLSLPAESRFISKKFKNEGIVRSKGKKTIQKFAQKRIQKARLVLSNRKSGRIQNKALITNVSAIQKGIRRSKFGFVTVRSKSEKRLEQLNIQQKISRASQAKNRKSNVEVRWTENSTRATSSRPRGKGRSQVSMSNNLVQVRIPNDFRPQFEVQNARLPSHPMNVYPSGSSFSSNNYNFHNSMGGGFQDMWPEPQHPSLRQAYSSPHEFDMDRRTLDPEIQRRISFIQSRTVGQNPTVLPDFKAPVSTSRMKLSDRFRMIMH